MISLIIFFFKSLPSNFVSYVDSVRFASKANFSIFQVLYMINALFTKPFENYLKTGTEGACCAPSAPVRTVAELLFSSSASPDA